MLAAAGYGQGLPTTRAFPGFGEHHPHPRTKASDAIAGYIDAYDPDFLVLMGTARKPPFDLQGQLPLAPVRSTCHTGVAFVALVSPFVLKRRRFNLRFFLFPTRRYRGVVGISERRPVHLEIGLRKKSAPDSF